MSKYDKMIALNKKASEEKIEKAELDLAKMDALVKLDVGSFWDQMLSLQSAVQAELAG